MKRVPFVAIILVSACFVSACANTSVATLPKREKQSETESVESVSIPDSESEEESEFIDYSGAYFSLDKEKYVFPAGEYFTLPVPSIKNANGESINLKYIARVYDEDSSLLASNVQRINLETGYYSLYFSFKDTSISNDTLTVSLIAIDKDDIPLVSFNSDGDKSRLVQPPVYNWGTQNASWKILKDGYKNSIDGVLEITAGANYEEITYCRDGAGVNFKSPVSVNSAQSFKVTLLQATDEFRSRVVIGFYGNNGVYSDEFWYHPNKQTWQSYEFTIQSILGKKWYDEDGEEYGGTITEIRGIYVKNTFCLDKMYIDEISYKAK